jgi:hypothetical protein
MTIVEEHVLAADVARRALEVILHNGLDAWLYSGKDWLSCASLYASSISCSHSTGC